MESSGFGHESLDTSGLYSSDIDMVMQQANCDKPEAVRLLRENSNSLSKTLWTLRNSSGESGEATAT